MAKVSSNAIVIAFKTQALEKARALAKEIDTRVKSALKTIKDVNVRRQFAATQKEIAAERNADLDRRERELRARQIRAREDADASAQARQGVNRVRALAGKAERGLGIAATGDVTGALALLGTVPGLGQLAAAAAGVAAIARIVLPLLQKELDAKFKAQENRLLLRQQRAFAAADPAERFKNEMDFRDKATRDAVREALQQDRAARAGGWRRRGAYTVPE